jgi:CBS domain-containing protein
LGAEPPTARSEFFVAIAGPLVSAALGAGFALLAWVGWQAGWALPARVVLEDLAWINFWVLFFNLLPAFPMDGGRVLRSFFWGVSGDVLRATRWASLLGQGFAWMFIGLGVWAFVEGAGIGGLWPVLIGLFLYNAARGSYRQLLVRQALGGEPVSRFLDPEPVVVPPGLSLRDWVEDYVYRYRRRGFPVVGEGRLEGLITTGSLGGYPRESWGRHTVEEAMDRDVGALSISPGADAYEALERMQTLGSSRLLVTEGDRLLGTVGSKDLKRFLELKLETEPEGPGQDPVPPASRYEGNRSEARISQG